MSFLIRSLIGAAPMLMGGGRKSGRRPFQVDPPPFSAQGMANTFMSGLGNQLSQAGQAAFAPEPEPEQDRRYTTGQEDDSQYGLGTGDNGGQPWPQPNQGVAQAPKKAPLGFTWGGGTRTGQHSRNESSAIQAQYAAGRANYEAMLAARRRAYGGGAG